jgi:hypothetical protein
MLAYPKSNIYQRSLHTYTNKQAQSNPQQDHRNNLASPIIIVNDFEEEDQIRR